LPALPLTRPVMSKQSDRKTAFLSRLGAPFKRSRSKSPKPKEVEDERSPPAKPELHPPGVDSISQVATAQSPSTSQTIEVPTSNPSDVTAISKRPGSKSSHPEKVVDESHRAAESDHRSTTISRDSADVATIDTFDMRGTSPGSAFNPSNPYMVITGADADSTTPPTASDKAKSAMDMILKGLKKTLEVVERSSDMMPPLKTAAAAILGLWDVVEVCLLLYSFTQRQTNRVSSRLKTKTT